MAPSTSKHRSITYYPASKKYVIEDESGRKSEIKKESIPYGPIGVAGAGVLADNTTSVSMTKSDDSTAKNKNKENKLNQTNG
jgi:hypothetical protein